MAILDDEFQSEIWRTAKTEIAVTDLNSYIQANDFIARLQGIKKTVQEKFMIPKAKAAEAHRSLCALEKTFLNPLERKLTELKTATTAWYAAEQRRIEAEAERKRKEAEELANLSAEAEGAGETALAEEAIAEAAIAASTVTVIPKVKGTSMREQWKAVVVDVTQLPGEYLIPNQLLLDKMAQATKGKVTIPGVRFEKSYINATKAK